MFDGQDDPAQNNHENDGADGAMPNNGADVDEMDDQPDLGAQAQMQEQDGFIMINNPPGQVNQGSNNSGAENVGGANAGVKPEFGPMASKILAPSIGGAVTHPSAGANAGTMVPQNFNTHV